jgi:signal transduction histidine kinase
VTNLILIGVVAAVVGLVSGYAIGSRRRGPNPLSVALSGLASELEQGRDPAVGQDAPPEIRRLQVALERGWVPRDAPREEALRQALGRMAAFLQESVEAPLEKVRGGDEELLREGVDRALGGLKDLEFFLREPLTPDETHNLVPLVQQVVRDFIADWEVAVRFAAPATPVRAHIHRDTFMDAVYLLLHNAGHFSEWKTVEVIVEEADGRARIVIRDRGPGFSPEALQRARDLFYTTKPAGLGLGIPFARRIIEGFGGQLEIRNLDADGAEVSLTLPGA